MAGIRLGFVVLAVCLVPSVWAQPQNRPIKRPPNNQLAIEGAETPVGRVELPAAVAGVTSQLVFHTSPLSSKGLLSQQVEDAIKALDKANGNATFLKLRAFVAGNGDLRRVQAIVTELFSARKWPLPALTTVQVGSLLQDGAQVVIESISEEKRPINTSGLKFIQAIEGASGADAIAALSTTLAGGIPLRITCFADSAAEADAARAAAAKQFPKAAGVFAQSTRYTLGAKVACEAIAASGPVNVPKLLLAGAQVTFGDSEADLKVAIERLDKALSTFNVTTAKAVQVNAYASSKAIAEKVRTLIPTPATAVFVEALSAPDATLEVEAVVPLP